MLCFPPLDIEGGEIFDIKIGVDTISNQSESSKQEIDSSYKIVFRGTGKLNSSHIVVISISFKHLITYIQYKRFVCVLFFILFSITL